MIYDPIKYMVEEIPSFAAFARLLHPLYTHPKIQQRVASGDIVFTIEEIIDVTTGDFLGSWDEECFDFAGAESSVVDKLDDQFRIHFKMKKRVPRRPFNSKGERNVGRDFIQFLSPMPPEKAPRRIRSLDDFYRLASNAEIQVAILLHPGGLRSTHYFEAYKNHIEDRSMVDGSFSHYTKRQFERSFYAKAIQQGALFLEKDGS